MMPGYESRNKRTVGLGPMSIGAPSSAGPAAGPMSIGQNQAATPPNLRDSSEEAANCGACKHFTGQGCSKFGGYPVEAAQVCDAFEAPGEEMSDMADGGTDPYEMEA